MSSMDITYDELEDRLRAYFTWHRQLSKRQVHLWETLEPLLGGKRQPPARFAVLGTHPLVVAGLGVLALAAITLAALKIDMGDGPEPITVREDRSGPIVGDRVIEVPGELSLLEKHGFREAAGAVEPAIQLVPFPVEVPSYIPQELEVWSVTAYFHHPTGTGMLELFYKGPDGGIQEPAFTVRWSDTNEPPPDWAPVAESSFTAAGNTWNLTRRQWRDFATYEAQTWTTDGVNISADIRVVGMTDDEAVQELKKALESMGQAAQ